QVRQELGKAADRRVDTYRDVRMLGKQRLVQRVAHAEQFLEFEPPLTSLVRGAKLEDGRDGAAVVGGEGRIDRVGRRKELRRARDVGDVGDSLAREHRVIWHAELLRALDFAVPVGAFDEPHRKAPLSRAAERDQPVAYRRRALLVSLNRQSGRELTCQGFKNVQRQLQPFGLFGVEGDANPTLSGNACQYL